METAISISVELIKLVIPLAAGRLPDRLGGLITSDSSKILQTLTADAQSKFFEAEVMSRRLTLMVNKFYDAVQRKCGTTAGINFAEDEDLQEQWKNVRSLAADIYRTAARSFGNTSLNSVTRLEALQIMVNCTAVEHLLEPQIILKSWYDCVTFLFDDAKFRTIIRENLTDVIGADTRSFNRMLSIMVYIEIYALQLSLTYDDDEKEPTLEKLLDTIHKPPSLAEKYWGFVPKVQMTVEQAAGINKLPEIKLSLIEDKQDSGQDNTSDNESSRVENTGSLGVPSTKGEPVRKHSSKDNTSDNESSPVENTGSLPVPSAEGEPVRKHSFSLAPPIKAPKYVTNRQRLRHYVLHWKTLLAIGIFLLITMIIIIGVAVGLTRNAKAHNKHMCIADTGCWKAQLPSCVAYNKYEGTKNVTKSGKHCQRWSAQAPQTHTFSSVGDHNFCRMADDEMVPWCYTTDPNTRLEYCFESCTKVNTCSNQLPNGARTCWFTDIPGCTIKNIYQGTKSTTVSGKRCQYWTETQKHQSEGNHNYCRLPDNKSIPWCYTTDPDIPWAYCFQSCTLEQPQPHALQIWNASYRQIRTISAQTCWEECELDGHLGCVSATYNEDDSACNLFTSGFTASLSSSHTSFVRTNVVYGMKFNGYRLKNHYARFDDVSSEYECFDRCLRDNRTQKCVASAYTKLIDYHRCYLFSSNFEIMKEEQWISVIRTRRLWTKHAETRLWHDYGGATTTDDVVCFMYCLINEDKCAATTFADPSPFGANCFFICPDHTNTSEIEWTSYN